MKVKSEYFFTDIKSISDLERLPLDEGEVLLVPLLVAPPLADVAVPDDHLPAVLVEAGVEVEGQVIRCG